MRLESLLGSLGLLALLLFFPGSSAQGEASDPWIGCWARSYDAAYLAKHPKQLVTAMTLEVSEGDSDGYHADVTVKFRNKKATYTNFDGAECKLAGPGKDRLSCVMGGVFMGQFWLEPAGKNMKLAMHGGNERIPLLPGVDTSNFVLLTPKNPEHALFLLEPTACG
jgi:hypothetical protein